MGTHSKIISLDDGSLVFIDGIQDICKHNQRDAVYQSASGKMIFWYTYRQWAHLPEDARYTLIFMHHEEIEDPIVMGTSQCRRCKKIDFPNGLDYQ